MAVDSLPRLQVRTDAIAAQRQSAHLVGICGSGMSALASMLLDVGWSVTGSDLLPTEPLLGNFRQRGVEIHRGHAAANLPLRCDVLVYSAAISADNPERQAARERAVPEMSYSQMLGHWMRARRGICIAGTHGKSTTAAMTASILLNSGREPSACIGAELRATGRGGWAGTSDLFVVESCEYRRSFLDLAPEFAAILNVEPDHFDCYNDFRETCDAFQKFATRVARDGLLVVPGDCATVAEITRSVLARVETFSTTRGSDWRGSDVGPTRDGVRFRVSHRGRSFAEFVLNIPGRHNVLNALAAIALCHEVGVETRELQESLAEFRGVRRRFEIIGSWRGVTLVDDYAHHPTEVRATLQTARDRFAGRRVWCVFQPHQVSRTRALLQPFVESLAAADELLIAPVYAARERTDAETEILSRELVARIAALGGKARFCGDLDRIVATLDDEARPGDVVLTMGAGDIERVHHELTGRLQRHLAS
jgi:UDP-N-acetylmuramate--alanine ligase